MTPKTLLLPLICGLALPVCAAAETGTPVDPASVDVRQRMSMAYANLSDEFFKDLVAPPDMMKLFLVTKQQVLATVCEGFEIDDTRLNEVLNTLLASTIVDGSPTALMLGRVMHGYGIVKGGEIALATHDPDSYCAYGAELRAELLSEEGGAAIDVLKPAP